MRRTEHLHHTREQIAQAIEDAAAIVTEAELAPELQEVAFSKAIDLLTAKQIFFEQTPMALGGLAIPTDARH